MTLRSLISQQELHLLAMAVLPTNLDQFVAQDLASRQAAEALLFAYLATIPAPKIRGRRIRAGQLVATFPDRTHPAGSQAIVLEGGQAIDRPAEPWHYEDPQTDWQQWLSWFIYVNGLPVPSSTRAPATSPARSVGDETLRIEMIRQAMERQGFDFAAHELSMAESQAQIMRTAEETQAVKGPRRGRGTRKQSSSLEERGASRRGATNPLSGSGWGGERRGSPAPRTKDPAASFSTANPLRVSGRIGIGSIVETRGGRTGVVERIEGRCYYLAGSQACHYREDLTLVS